MAKGIIAFDFDNTLEKYNRIIGALYLLRLDKIIPGKIKHRVFPDVWESLEELREKHLLVIISKTRILSEDMKRRRIEESPLAQYFSRIYVVSKKDKNTYLEIMEDLKRNIGNVDGMVFVGDDPIEDYEIPRSAGINAVLLDRAGRNNVSEKIRSLLELPKYLQCDSHERR